MTTAVSVSGFAFGPKAIQVSAGAVVTWTNSDNVNHNVTFTNAAVGATPDFATGSKALAMPSAVGTYDYHCTIHPSMIGSVLVK